MAGLLDLSDTFVCKELKETYRPRFDVWYTTIAPKVFLNKKKATIDEQVEDSGAKLESNTPKADREPHPSEKEQADRIAIAFLEVQHPSMKLPRPRKLRPIRLMTATRATPIPLLPT